MAVAMSLGPYIKREPGDEVQASEKIIYRVFLDCLSNPSRTSIEHAIVRAAHRLGVPRRRVLDIVRKVNNDVDFNFRPGAIQ